MRIYSKNILAKFHSNPIWNDGASGCFLKKLLQQKHQQKEEQ